MDLTYVNVLIIVGVVALLGAFIEDAGKRQERVLSEKLAALESKLDELLARHT